MGTCEYKNEGGKLALRNPAIGEEIYLPSMLCDDHMRIVFFGGRCTITEILPSISGGKKAWLVKVEEHNGWHDYLKIMSIQEKLATKYKDARAKWVPDACFFDDPSEHWEGY